MKAIFQLITIFSAFATSCQSQTSGNSLDPVFFQKKFKETPNAIVLDVRTPEEFQEGIIDSAVNIDYNNSSFKAEIAKLDTAAVYFVYCRSGKRSAAAADYMRTSGFKKVFELSGGILSWKDRQLPVNVPKK